MDQLGRRGGLFLEWASAVFRDGERRERGELSEDNSSSVRRSISSGIVVSFPFPGREGEKGQGGSRARPGWLPTGFAGARFFPATGSPVCAVRPPTWPAPLVLPPFLDAREGTGLRGLGSRDC